MSDSMLSSEELKAWNERLNLSPETRSVIDQVRIVCQSAGEPIFEDSNTSQPYPSPMRAKGEQGANS